MVGIIISMRIIQLMPYQMQIIQYCCNYRTKGVLGMQNSNFYLAKMQKQFFLG